MAREFIAPNVGSTGKRRIVPIMAIDFIAGQINQKGSPIESRETSNGKTYYAPYGMKGPSIGGRTRKWSFINFMHISKGGFRKTPLTIGEVEQRNRFITAQSSARKTLTSLSVLTKVQEDFTNGVTRAGANPSEYATILGWVFAVRMAQILAGQEITADTTSWWEN